MLITVFTLTIFYSVQCITAPGTALVGGKRDVSNMLASSNELLDDKLVSEYLKKRVSEIIKYQVYSLV